MSGSCCDFDCPFFFGFLSGVLPIIFHSHLLDFPIHSSWAVSNLSGNEQLDEEKKERAGYGDCCKDLQIDHPELLSIKNPNAILLLHDPHIQFLFWWQTSLPHKLSYPTTSLSLSLTEGIPQFADWSSHRHITIHTDWILLKLFPAASPFPKKLIFFCLQLQLLQVTIIMRICKASQAARERSTGEGVCGATQYSNHNFNQVFRSLGEKFSTQTPQFLLHNLSLSLWIPMQMMKIEGSSLQPFFFPRENSPREETF